MKGGAATLAASAVGCFGYAVAIEPHWLKIVQRDLLIDRLPQGLAGARLVQISDLHVGPRVSDAYLVDSLERARALGPDIVAFTGDFITHRAGRAEAQFQQLRDVLAHMPRGRLATVGVLGNHDYGLGWHDGAVASRVVAEAERAGIQILRNEVQGVAGLDIIGLDDLWSGRCDSAPALRARSHDAALVLLHNPDAADQQPWGGYRGWMLAGHTHGGQCKPPFLPPPLLPVRNKRYVAGEVRVNELRTLYINRGVGHLIQARFNVRPEITLFTLHDAAQLRSAD